MGRVQGLVVEWHTTTSDLVLRVNQFSCLEKIYGSACSRRQETSGQPSWVKWWWWVPLPLMLTVHNKLIGAQESAVEGYPPVFCRRVVSCSLPSLFYFLSHPRRISPLNAAYKIIILALMALTAQ